MMELANISCVAMWWTAAVNPCGWSPFTVMRWLHCGNNLGYGGGEMLTAFQPLGVGMYMGGMRGGGIASNVPMLVRFFRDWTAARGAVIGVVVW